MFLMLFSMIISLLISSLLILIWFMQPKLINHEREKMSPFECGFDPMGSARTPFSLRFFLLAVIFLVFDIEIVLIMPMPIILLSAPLNMIMSPIIFLTILLLGTMHEYNEGALDWAN